VKPSPSQRIGRYRVLRELARGGQGVVFLGEDRGGNEVAIKLLREQATDDESLVRFHNEARITALLKHPNLVPLIEAGVAPQGPFLVTPWIRGEDLQKLVYRGGPLPERDAVELCVGLADALEAAHRAGVLHRDVKPGNVLIDERGEARLTDFGLASSLTPTERLTQTGDLLGTPLYMAPEQALGLRRDFSPATDVYGLGATLFFLLTGQGPFGGATTLEVLEQVVGEPAPSPRTLRADLDSGLEAICLRCLEKEPSARYASAAELREALLAWEARAERASLARVGPALAGVIVLLLFLLGYLYAQPGAEPAPSASASASASPRPSPSPSASASAAAPEPGAAALARAEAARQARRWREARDAADEALAARPRDPRAYALRAQAALQLGEPARGWADYRRARELGGEVGPEQLEEWDEDPRVRRILWQTWLPEGELEELALLAADYVLHGGTLDLARELRRLDELAARAPVLAGLEGEARLRAFVGWFRAEVATGTREAYYSPFTSCLHCVLDRREGIHFTCSLLAIALGRRLGVELQGVCFPGQFLARTPGEPPLIVDAFAGSVQTLARFSEARFRGRPVPARRLRPGTRPELMARMLGFLARNLESKGQRLEGGRAVRLIRLLVRDDPDLMKRAFGED